jgi:PilZ domain
VEGRAPCNSRFVFGLRIFLESAAMTEGPFQDSGRGRRKSSRRSFSYPVRALGPNAVQWDGFIVDISDSGAQLEFFDTGGIPDDFSLLIGGKATVQRACHVVWRSGDRLGVKFLRHPEQKPPG